MIHFIDERTGAILIEDLVIRSTFPGRLRGFSFKKPPEHKTAMLFLDTSKVHTFGMLFLLDLYFFDASLHCIGFKRGIPPNSFPSSPKGTRHILEVPCRHGKSTHLFNEGRKASLILGVRT
jgi:uncharacterized membrane protein (UPF0127 family)